MPNKRRLGRNFARIVRLCVTLACPLFGLHGASAAVVLLKFGYILSPGSQLGRGEKVFAAEVAKRTAGRYEIEDYPDAMLGGELAMLKDLRLGALDLAFITGAPLPNVVPEAGVFNVPFLFPDVEAAWSVLDGPIGHAYLKAFGNAGMVGLAWGENGMRQLTTSKRTVRTPSDLRGLKLRLPQSDVMTAGFKALGANVEQLPFPQVYGALRGGDIDGQENPIATIIASRFYEVQTHLSLTSHVYDPAIILMSTDAFTSLSAEDQLAFEAAAHAAAAESRIAAGEAQANGIAVLEAKGMVVTRDIDKAAFIDAIASAAPTFDRMFGHETIGKIRRAAAETRRRPETSSLPSP